MHELIRELSSAGVTAPSHRGAGAFLPAAPSALDSLLEGTQSRSLARAANQPHSIATMN